MVVVDGVAAAAAAAFFVTAGGGAVAAAIISGTAEVVPCGSAMGGILPRRVAGDKLSACGAADNEDVGASVVVAAIFSSSSSSSSSSLWEERGRETRAGEVTCTATE